MGHRLTPIGGDAFDEVVDRILGMADQALGKHQHGDQYWQMHQKKAGYHRLV